MPGGLGRGDVELFNASVASLERRWDASIKTCRKHPDKRFIDVLQPEGRYAEALSRRVR